MTSSIHTGHPENMFSGIRFLQTGRTGRAQYVSVGESTCDAASIDLRKQTQEVLCC